MAHIRDEINRITPGFNSGWEDIMGPTSRNGGATGKLVWYFQHAPAESLDLDEVFERVLVDIGDQKVVFTIGKAGILWKLDRKSGASEYGVVLAVITIGCVGAML